MILPSRESEESVRVCGAPSRFRHRCPLAASALAFAIVANGCAPLATDSARRDTFHRDPPRTASVVAAGQGIKTGPVTPATHDTGPLVRITEVTTRVPASWETPPLVGRLQHHRTVEGENLLEIARQSGLGFREVRDANPTIDEWEPHAGVDLLLPSRFILPRSSNRGLIINVPEMRRYFFPTDALVGERVPVLTWPIGIGAEEAPSPVGAFAVKSKDENPTWVVPASIQRTMDHPVSVVPPGPDNPLGAYRIRLSIDLYAIHGTNDPWTVGRLTTHGCIRLYPEDIETLYPLVDAGTPGEIVYQPVKFGEAKGRIYVEVHQDVYRMYPDLEAHAFDVLAQSGLGARVDSEQVRAAVRGKTGVPIDVTLGAPTAAKPDVHVVHGTSHDGDV
jgi:L,D-transpeptidase ErfK/SrfK